MLYVSDAIRRLDIFIAEVKSNMPAISTELAGVFVVDKIEQIRKFGIGSYSRALYVRPSAFRGKELNGAGRSFIEQKIRAKQRTNWAEFRQAQGLQVRFVDVYYSGQMLNSTGIQRRNVSSYKYYAIVGARNDEAAKKLSVNRDRYGAFLHPTREQGDKMGKEAINRIGLIYKRVLLT